MHKRELAKKQRYDRESGGDSQRQLHVVKDNKGNYDRKSGKDLWEMSRNTLGTQISRVAKPAHSVFDSLDVRPRTV
jgi:hypothetical protein